jgi:chemotaxis protein CheC
MELSNIQFDALREVGNIGAGNAATALSQILNKRIDMSVPNVSFLPFYQVPDVVGGAENIVAGVYLKVTGNAPGSILFLLPEDSALKLIGMLLGEKRLSRLALDDMDKSALMELGNILSGSFLNALANFTDLVLLPSVPALALDMAGAVLSTILIELGEKSDQALVIETDFNDQETFIRGHFFLLPDPESLEILLKSIGVNMDE